MIKKTLYLTEEANSFWSELLGSCSEKNASTLFEKMVRESYEHHLEGGANCQKKNDDAGSPQLVEILNKLKSIDSDTNKKVFCLVELINSLLSTLTTPASAYVVSEEKPHAWLVNAEEVFKKKIYSQQHNKITRGDY